LEQRAKVEGVLPDELTPEQWLQHFYDQRKGSGKLASGTPQMRTSSVTEA